MITCSKCNEDKSEDEYYAHSTNKSRLWKYCKECARADMRRYNRENREKIHESCMANIRRHRAETSELATVKGKFTKEEDEYLLSQKGILTNREIALQMKRSYNSVLRRTTRLYEQGKKK